MKRKIKDISFGTTFGDVAVQNALGDTLMDLVSELTPENINTKEVDIVLTINGKEYNHEEFFSNLVEHYFDHVQKHAENILVEETTDKIDELKNTLEILRDGVDGLRDKLACEFRFLKADS